MLVVVSLSHSALRNCSAPLSGTPQDAIRQAAHALAPLAHKHKLVVSHELGAQVGLLTLDTPAYKQVELHPHGLIGAQAEGMLGTLLKQELHSSPLFDAPPTSTATILTVVEVDANDALPSPTPKRIFAIQTIKRMLRHHAVVICSGIGLSMAADAPAHVGNGGRSRAVRDAQRVEAVIDSDRVSALMAKELDADFLLLAAGVDGVYVNWGSPDAKLIPVATPSELSRLHFDANSISAKVEAACDFVEATGACAAIGKLDDVEKLVAGRAGTLIKPDSQPRWLKRLERATPAEA